MSVRVQQVVRTLTERIEVITCGERRRVWTPEQKREIVAENVAPGLTAAEVARKRGLSTGLLSTWRQQLLANFESCALQPASPGSGATRIKLWMHLPDG